MTAPIFSTAVQGSESSSTKEGVVFHLASLNKDERAATFEAIDRFRANNPDRPVSIIDHTVRHGFSASSIFDRITGKDRSPAEYALEILQNIGPIPQGRNGAAWDGQRHVIVCGNDRVVGHSDVTCNTLAALSLTTNARVPMVYLDDRFDPRFALDKNMVLLRDGAAAAHRIGYAYGAEVVDQTDTAQITDALDRAVRADYSDHNYVPVEYRSGQPPFLIGQRLSPDLAA